MKINDKLYGFTVTNVERVDEVDATLVDMLHDKSGARLIFLDRRDENTTFTIGFKTTPTDDTGVFHILEHSVLCGSKKFPIKDPFTELLKGSVSTYLNALTSGDKTLYPVSSKNPKAFRGLVDVYLDAVFNPLALENPCIFMQEGHRYEIDEDGELSISGVVYNEMKGVYSGADEYADYLVTRLSCRGGTYSYDAGGNPDHIPELTYESFKAAHDRFYHPSNACLFLDGDVVTDEILPLISSYLDAYELRENDIEITDGEPPSTEVMTATYPIEEEEDPTDKTRIYLCYNSFEHAKREELSALSLVTEAVADLNASPLTKRILDTGLCESFNFFGTRSYKVNALNAIFIGVKDGKEDELIRVYETALRDIIASGIPREAMEAALKRREFNVRESDYGTYPAGMVYMRSCIDSAMLGESPAEALRYEGVLAFLREKLDSNYYENILDEVVSTPHATLILHPDPEFAEKKDEELEEKLHALLDGMTDAEKSELTRQNELLREWQNTPNTKEELDTLPTLTVSDLNTEPHSIPIEVTHIDGAEVVLHPIHTGGIAYADLYFDATDADEDEIHYIRLFTELMFEWNTERGSSTAFRSRTKRHLGAFYLSFYTAKRDEGERLYLHLHASCLDTEKDNALDVIEEYLYSTRYDDPEVLRQNLKQLYTYSLESVTTRGEWYANSRCAARYSVFEAINEHLGGYEYHRFIKELAYCDESKYDEILARLVAIRDKYFCRERLTIGLTEPDGIDYARGLVGIVRTGGTKSCTSPVKPLERINEGIAVPTTVSFASMGSDLNQVDGARFTGAYSLYQGIASLEILWNEIRVRNGAYDTGYFNKPTGGIGCYSYRDPSPAASLAYFRRLNDEMTAFLNTPHDLLKFIIGVFGASDTICTPRSDGSLGTKRHLAGRVHEDFVRRRRECLETTTEDLVRINDTVREALSHATFTVTGPRDELEKLEGIDRILDI